MFTKIAKYVLYVFVAMFVLSGALVLTASQAHAQAPTGPVTATLQLKAGGKGTPLLIHSGDWVQVTFPTTFSKTITIDADANYAYSVDVEDKDPEPSKTGVDNKRGHFLAMGIELAPPATIFTVTNQDPAQDGQKPFFVGLMFKSDEAVSINVSISAKYPGTPPVSNLYKWTELEVVADESKDIQMISGQTIRFNGLPTTTTGTPPVSTTNTTIEITVEGGVALWNGIPTVPDGLQSKLSVKVESDKNYTLKAFQPVRIRIKTDKSTTLLYTIVSK